MGRSSRIASGSGNRTIGCAFCDRTFKGSVKMVNKLAEMHMRVEHNAATEKLPDKLQTNRNHTPEEFLHNNAEFGVNQNNKSIEAYMAHKRLKIIQDLRDQGVDV